MGRYLLDCIADKCPVNSALSGSISLDSPRSNFVGDAGCEGGWMRYVGFMDWQQIVSLLVVAATAGVFIWARWRRPQQPWKARGACGCNRNALPRPKESIRFHARKGETARVIVKLS